MYGRGQLTRKVLSRRLTNDDLSSKLLAAYAEEDENSKVQSEAVR